MQYNTKSNMTVFYILVAASVIIVASGLVVIPLINEAAAGPRALDTRSEVLAYYAVNSVSSTGS